MPSGLMPEMLWSRRENRKEKRYRGARGSPCAPSLDERLMERGKEKRRALCLVGGVYLWWWWWWWWWWWEVGVVHVERVWYRRGPLVEWWRRVSGGQVASAIVRRASCGALLWSGEVVGDVGGVGGPWWRLCGVCVEVCSGEA